MVSSGNKAEDSEGNHSTPRNLVDVCFIPHNIPAVSFKKNREESIEASRVTIQI